MITVQGEGDKNSKYNQIIRFTGISLLKCISVSGIYLDGKKTNKKEQEDLRLFVRDSIKRLAKMVCRFVV